MIDKNFTFEDIMSGIKRQKKTYEKTYNKKLKLLFKNKPEEAISLFMIRLKLYKKIRSHLDFKINCFAKVKPVEESDLNSKDSIYTAGQKSAYLEMQQHIDSQLCKLDNMLDCIKRNNPAIARLLSKEFVNS